MVSGEKRNCDGDSGLERAAAILMDVEGTTTSISFVKDTLFPYVREHLKAYVESNWENDEFKKDLEALKTQAKKDEEDKLENFCPIEEGDNEKESLMKNVLWQMDVDRKTTALKQLQGHIWREGYGSGKLKGHVFSDVPQMMKKWCEDDRKLYIYSSGSVEAQKLLFKNSEAGDLEAFITGHFDTETGPKTEASSYTSIASAMGFDASQILFLTDSVKEAVAADKAGFQVTLVVRDGNAPLTDDEKKAFTTVTSFKELVFESSTKKKKISEEGQEVEKVNNVEKVDDASEVKNGESGGEKMEVESTENKVSGTESEKVEKEEAKVEANKPEVEKNEAEASMSVDDGTKAEEDATDKEKETAVTSSSSTTTGDDSQAKETTEEIEAEKKTEDAGDSTKSTNGDAGSGEDETTTTTTNGESNGVDDHSKNGDAKVDGEVNGSDEGAAPAGEEPAVVVKKLNPEDQADSTVEVTA